MMLLPMLSMKSDIFLLAPVPTANMIMTALTPMIIPSMVSTERILFTRSDLKETLIVRSGSIINLPGQDEISNPETSPNPSFEQELCPMLVEGLISGAALRVLDAGGAAFLAVAFRY